MTDNPTATPDRVVIDRTFDAPATLVWAMWTDPEHFAAWYGPSGVAIPVAGSTCASADGDVSAWRCRHPRCDAYVVPWRTHAC